jgi:lysophospholipase L1-like esterase
MRQYQRMVALGSSFAAGPGIAPVQDRAAGRSACNYPHLVAQGLGAHLTDATMSGATTATILDTPQRVGVRRFPPQVAAVSTDADLVTVTAGGNDLGYLGGVVATALLGTLQRHRLTRPVAHRVQARRPLAAVTAEQEQAVTDGLVRVVEAVRDRAPKARVVLVDYLPIFTDDVAISSGGPFRNSEVWHFRGVAAALSRAIRAASTQTGADLVPASAFQHSHGASTSEPWVNGLQPVRHFSSSFHPTAAGMAVVADAVLAQLERAPRS